MAPGFRSSTTSTCLIDMPVPAGMNKSIANVCKLRIEFIWLIINTLLLKGIRPQKYIKCLKWCKNTDFHAFLKCQQYYVVIPTKNSLLITHIPLRNTLPYFQDCSCSGYVGPTLFLNPVCHFAQYVMYCGIHQLPRLWEFTLN